MKRIVNKLKRGERGYVLILVLILLVVGGLVITPLLGFMFTGLAAGQAYETKIDELYAADTGVEDALWQMMNAPPTSFDYSFQLPAVNNMTVDVTIADIGGDVYKITSTAENTTLESYISISSELIDEDTYGPYGGSGDIEDENVITEPGATITSNIMGNSKVNGDGPLTVTGNIEGDAIVNIVGDVTLNGNIIDNTIVRVFGNLTLDGSIQHNAEVYVSGNLTMNGSIDDNARVGVGENLDVDGDINQDVWVGGTITVGGSMNADNLGLENIPFDTACPLTSAGLEIFTWEIV